MRLRIAFLFPVSFVGGAELSMLEAISRLDKNKYDPLLMLPAKGPLEELSRSYDLESLILPWPKSILSASRNSGFVDALRVARDFLSFSSQLQKTLQQQNSDLLHANGFKADIAAMLHAHMRRDPRVILHLRDILSGKRRTLFRLLSKGCPAQLIANSGSTAAAAGWTKRCHVIYNGIDTDHYSPSTDRSSLRGRLGIGAEEFCIIAAGHIAPLKGYDILIRSLPTLLRSLPDAHVHIFGKSNYGGFMDHERELHKLARERDVSDAITWHGQVDDLLPWYQAADLAVQPSRSEGFGRSAAEAGACALAAIVSDTGGLREVVSDGETGRRISVEDPESLSEAMLRLALNPDERRRMGVNARQRIAELFSVTSQKDALEKLYDKFPPREAHGSSS
ncbi:MAG: glycosyltransferase family 4 protein [Planctomycetes bacterium]|nr:glycosyltransferase family 4 protein [Planctomycetota bacterium]